MGVQGLLRNLKTVTTQRHIRDYKGLTIAIDTYAWLHRIIKGKCCNQLFNFQISNKFINEIMSRIDKFREYGITVIMVFDGAPLPGKVEEEKARKARREQCEEEAMQLLNEGNSILGNKKLIESVDITPEIAYRLIETLKKKNIQFIVAPYEADAELAYLSRKGIADIILTEDSDLLAYGAKKVLYKYDPKTYIGDEIELENIKKNDDPALKLFTHSMFLSACIMSGCDYVSTISGIGHKTAFRLISSNGTGGKAIEEARRIKVVSSTYEDNFIKAFLIFRFQYVYCPLQKKCVMVNDLETELNKEKSKEKLRWIDECLDDYILTNLMSGKFNFIDFIGEKPEDAIARGIGEGEIHPMTKKPYIPSSDNLTQVFNLRRSKTKVKKADTHNTTIESYFKSKEVVETRSFQFRKNNNINIELEPVEEEENSKTNFPIQPKLLLDQSTSKSTFDSRMEYLLAPVFDSEWFDKFKGREQEETMNGV